MPLPKNWVEELILEWLLLKEYTVISNIRLKSGKRGGTEEADILGLKINRKKTLEILHVEVGSLANNFEKNLANIKKKFSPERVKTIKEITTDTIGIAEYTINYKPLYVGSYVPKKQTTKLKNTLKKDNISFLTLEEVFKEIIKDIDQWKKDQVKKKLRTTRNITLPENLWLLNLIDTMKNKGLIKLE